MAYLLDTHALVWWWLTDPKLSKAAHDILSDSSNVISVSAVTGYEIANKVRAGQLPTMREPLAIYDFALERDGFSNLVLDPRHARHAGLIEGRHRDPFDRMIAAQALLEDLTVITKDRQIAALGCKVLW